MTAHRFRPGDLDDRFLGDLLSPGREQDAATGPPPVMCPLSPVSSIAHTPHYGSMEPMVLYPSSSPRRSGPLYRGAPVIAVLSVLALAGCSSGGGGDTPGSASGQGAGDAATLTAEVVAEYPSDPTSFVQGLEVMPEGDLLVSTGREGSSRIYRTPLTGAVSVGDGAGPPGAPVPTVSVDLDPEFFGEGSTRHGDTVWQLTWKDGVAVKRDAATLQETGRVQYPGEGWGLCTNGERLVMSDGSSTLTFRDPETFGETGRVEVTLDGEPVTQLNELDCSDGEVWANIWQSDRIVRISQATGEVTGVLDTSGLDLPARDRRGADVLNGIARVPGTPDHYLLTGKLWDTVYEVTVR